MPTWTVPSDTHSPGDTGHTTDHNHIADDLTLIATAFPVVSGSVGQVFPGWIAPTVASLTFGTTISVNAAAGNDFRLTLTASTGTIANPTNSTDGQRIDFQITQGTGGSFTVTWGANYDFGASGAPTLSTTAAKVDVIGFVYNATLGKWIYLGAALGN